LEAWVGPGSIKGLCMCSGGRSMQTDTSHLLYVSSSKLDAKDNGH